MKIRKARIKPREWNPTYNTRKCHGCKVRYDCKHGWNNEVCIRCEFGYFCLMTECKNYVGNNKCYFEKKIRSRKN